MTESRMPRRNLTVVKGGKGRKRAPRAAQPQSDLAARWRREEPQPTRSRKLEGDVISLMDGWIRQLERQVGLDSAANER